MEKKEHISHRDNSRTVRVRSISTTSVSCAVSWDAKLWSHRLCVSTAHQIRTFLFLL